MSFSSETKQELLAIKQPQCCQVASLSAMLTIGGYLSLSQAGMQLYFQTTSLPLARKVIQTVKSLYHVKVDVLAKKGVRLQKKNQYVMIIKEKAQKIIHELGLMHESSGFGQYVDDTLIQKPCCQKAYLRGAFLVSGSINHPSSSSYHLEISTPSLNLANDISSIMDNFELKSKTLQKKKMGLVYIKNSEKIADFLRIVGAHHALLKFEDERIKRDFVNSITRVMNMEIANQNKTFEAANKQLKNIEIVEKLVDESTLPKSVTEAMFLRKTYPEASLNELSELSKKHYPKQISKSGLNHRFRHIASLAKEALSYYDS